MKISDDQPHGAWLKNGNPACNLAGLPKCNATAKTTRKCCRQPAMKNGKCRYHGGHSTGPRTQEGLERARRGNWKHGAYSATAKEERKIFAKLIQRSRDLIREVNNS